MDLVKFIKRYTTTEGRDARALLAGVRAWNERQLIPVAANRTFTVEVPLPGGANGTECRFSTSTTTHDSIAAVDVEVRRASRDQVVFTVIFSEKDGEFLTVIWP